MLNLDPTSEFGARALRRLQHEHVIWLTTVSQNGQPEPSPVWFVWDGETFLTYSQPNAPKVRNIASRPLVALNFNTDALGDDVVVVTGDARISNEDPPLDQVPAYMDKYRDVWPSGMTPAATAAEYSAAIRVRPTKVRGF